MDIWASVGTHGPCSDPLCHGVVLAGRDVGCAEKLQTDLSPQMRCHAGWQRAGHDDGAQGRLWEVGGPGAGGPGDPRQGWSLLSSGARIRAGQLLRHSHRDLPLAGCRGDREGVAR